ncbi:MAG TPA: S41 family peptidase [Flavobacterium sp.]|jgi:C-terminal processing protease CtpA/Prc
MKKLTQYIALLFVIITLQSCQTDDENLVPSNLEVPDFVWKGMNLYYLWQQDVPDLDDDRFENQSDLNSYLEANNDPVALFQHLRVSPEIDRFSVIYSDYRILEGVLSGTTKNHGVDFGLNYQPGSSTDIFGWVRYILPNSDASTKNIERGDIFYAVNGTPLTVSNYQNLLGADTYTLNLADYVDGEIVPNGESVTLTKSVYSENPVLLKTVIEAGDSKIGYLMYNGFYPAYEQQLNAAFGEFASQNITDLVLDLRYNSGGSIATSTKLASMITGQFTGQLFAKEQWNTKLQEYYESENPENLRNNFTSSLGNAPVNHLNLTTVYVLTSRSTASASELVINGLAPYINVVQIGDFTIGKNVGSITLYDSPTFGRNGRNPNHFYAMQPIVLKVVNRDGFGDYQQNGLAPDYLLLENLANLGVLGSETEPLLSTAIGQITGNGRMLKQNPSRSFRHFKDLKSLKDIQNQMYRESLPAR